jgi:hypothetical protein
MNRDAGLYSAAIAVVVPLKRAVVHQYRVEIGGC